MVGLGVSMGFGGNNRKIRHGQPYHSTCNYTSYTTRITAGSLKHFELLLLWLPPFNFGMDWFRNSGPISIFKIIIWRTADAHTSIFYLCILLLCLTAAIFLHFYLKIIHTCAQHLLPSSITPDPSPASDCWWCYSTIYLGLSKTASG